MTFLDPLGREPNTPLDPERHDLAELLKRQAGNPRVWAALWQQAPRLASGNLINPNWFKLMPLNQLPDFHQLVSVARAWDLAYSEKQVAKKAPDFTATALGYLWKPRGDEYYIIVRSIARWRDDWPVTKRKLLSYALNDGRDTSILVESGGPQKASFLAVKDDKDLKGYRIKEILPIGDKVARSQGWIDFAETGRIYLVEEDWNFDFFEEASGFPNATHDDQIDAISILWAFFNTKMRKTSATRIGVKGLY